MNYWPFPTISPEQIAVLSCEEMDLLEALVATYVAEVELQRSAGRRPYIDD